MPLSERLERRIVDGERNGLEADLDEALQARPALEIVNDTLLEGMKIVGELFGSGQMQLPFVLQSAEVMKAAVGYLEPHMEKTDDDGKGTIVLATVKGDVHDIGKNLVDIILSNNGYTVVNLGIKQPISAILDAADEHRADAIGMSGLLVKSTVVMKENLEEMNARGVATKWPVLLGGAALTRAYVEDDLAAMYSGDVRYARDAFEGLRLMDAVMAVKRGDPGAVLPEPRGRRVSAAVPAGRAASPIRCRLAPTSRMRQRVPTPPFWGDRVVKGIALADYASMLDERATFLGQWGLRPTRGDGAVVRGARRDRGPAAAAALARADAVRAVARGRRRLRLLPVRVSKGDDLIVLARRRLRAHALHLPAPARDRVPVPGRLLPAEDSGEVDVVAFQLVTVGSRIARSPAKLFARGRLPRLPRAARPVGPAHRGARRVLAQAGA